MAKSKIQEMRKIAEEHGGNCLSKKYVNNKTKLLWECSKGDRWEATPNNVLRGTWCGQCSGKTKLTIEQMQELARKRGGKCLSNKYLNKDSKLLWECAEGHRWEARPGSIKRGQWCCHCAGTKKGSIEEMQKIAETRGGKCLSTTYVNSNTKLLWECAEGHKFEATPSNVKNRASWCRICSYKKRAEIGKLGIEDMQKLASERGGKCLSRNYINSHTKLQWECSEGHKWNMEPVIVRSGRWCPECSSGLGERICRQVFEQLFGKKFVTSYPKWLLNKNGNQMELDGYCPSIKLAFEHHGRQHYSTISYFIKTDEDLKLRQESDEQKRRLCKQNEVVLIEVPEIPVILPIKDVKRYIISECKNKGVALPSGYDFKEIDINKAFKTLPSKVALDELKEIARKNGGKCLSNKYINSHTNLLWECKKGHQWKAPPYRIVQGHWCRRCSFKEGADKKKLGLEVLQEIAKNRGGECLSEVYIDAGTKYLWKCAEGHLWEARARDVKRGSWCKKCGDKKSREAKKLGIEKMHRIAKERGGRCRSVIYVNKKTKLIWECSEGHQWEATPNNVLRGSWCPKYYRLNRTSIHKTRLG